jgi:hypothetical protein
MHKYHLIQSKLFTCLQLAKIKFYWKVNNEFGSQSPYILRNHFLNCDSFPLLCEESVILICEGAEYWPLL